MLFSDRPLFRNPLGWKEGSILKVDGGVVVSLPDGAVLSVQPDGSYEERPAGTAGPYEVAQVSGDKLVYNPGAFYVVATVGM